jgi:hypothetical protein
VGRAHRQRLNDNKVQKNEQGKRPAQKTVSTLFARIVEIYHWLTGDAAFARRVPPETWTTRLTPETEVVADLVRLVIIYSNECSKFGHP